MTISNNSTVILNVWALHHDGKRWESPEHFVPERYSAYPALALVYVASKDFADRDHLGYGASRRICPSIHLAERDLSVATAKLL
jgi:cytochrome P450